MLGWIRDAVEGSSGVRIEVEDFRFRPSGELRASGVSVAAGDASPFLRAEVVEAFWQWSRLRREMWHFDRIVVEGPLYFPEAPLPGGKEPREETSEQKEIPLAIDRLEILDGEMRYELDPDASWLQAVELAVPEASGRLLDGRLGLVVPGAAVDLEREPGRGEIPLRLATELAGPLTGPFTVDQLSLRGEGLELTAEGTLGEGPEKGLPFRLSARAEPARLLPDLSSGSGTLEVEGELELRELVGELDVEARGFPVALFEPWMGRETLETLGAVGTLLDADGELRLGGPSLEQLWGRLDLEWRRGEESLAVAEVKTLEPAGETGLRLAVSGRLLPRTAGERSWQTVLAAGSWETLGEAVFERGSVRMELPGMQRGLADLRRHWPRWLPAELVQWELPGSLRAQAELSGEIRSPEADLEALWQPGEGQRIALKARGNLPELRGEGSLDISGLPLEGWVSRMAGQPLEGQLDGTLELRGWPRDPEGKARVVLRDLLAPEMGIPLEEPIESLQIEARVADRRAWLDELQAVIGNSLLEGDGEVSLETPIDEGRLDVRWDHPAPGLAEARLAAVLSEGTVGIGASVEKEAVDRKVSSSEQPLVEEPPVEEPPVEVGVGELAEAEISAVEVSSERSRADLQARIPLANLGRIPELRELLSDLPIRAEGGPVELSWNLSGASSEWLASLLPELASEVAWQTSLEGDLTLDLARPEETNGTVRIESFSVELPGDEETGRPPFPMATREQSTLALAAGQLSLVVPALETGGGMVELRAKGPLSGLGALVESSTWPVELQELLATGGGDPGELYLLWPNFDTEELLAWSGALPAELRLRGDLSVALDLDPQKLDQATAEVRIEELVFSQDDHRLEAEEPLRLVLRDRRFQLDPGRLRFDGLALRMGGTGKLVGSWGSKADPLAVADLDLRADGAFPMVLLDPFLAGGRGDGFALIDLRAQGERLEDLELDLQVQPGDGRIVFVEPYLSEITGIETRVVGRGGRYQIGPGELELNGGQLNFEGTWSEEEGLKLDGNLGSVPYRLDYGLSIVTTGNFDLLWREEGESRLGANLLVERGVLRRDLDLDRELLERIFGTPLEPTLADEEGVDFELDLSIATVDGVRVKNNLADLRTTWSPIRVTGSSRQPIIAGGIDVERGGLLFAYGQTVRIDSAALTFSGLPGVPPELELETTSSLEDQGLGARASNDVFYSENPLAEGSSTGRGQILAEGLGAYVGNRLVGALGEPLGRTRVSLQPLRIFGETDPDARLTFSRDLSPILSFIVAINLRDTQDRTYLLNLERVPRWPRFAAQVFSNEEEDQGAAVLHTWEFGGSGGELESGEYRLESIELEIPDSIEKSWILGAIPYEEREPLPASADFDVEIDVADALSRRGFPNAEVAVELIPLETEDRARLRVEVDPGARLEVEFTGARLPRSQRRRIAQLFRPGVGEEESLDRVRERTARVFRGLGYPRPEVTVELAQDVLEDPPGHRLKVHTVPGDRWKPKTPEFVGVDEEAATALQLAFSGRGERVELALESNAARRRLLSTLASLGYAQADWTGTRLDEESMELTVDVELGPRRKLGEVRIEGWPEALDAPPEPAVRSGQSLRAAAVAGAALDLERRLRREGYGEARVRPNSHPVEGAEHVFDLVLEADPGTQRLLTEVSARGEEVTRPSWIRRVAGLEPGTLVRSRELAEARRRLLKIGAFETVQVDTETLEGVPGENGEVPTAVIFQVEEHPRYALAAGLRWVSSEGLSTVVDVVDRNFTGRGTTIGFRVRYSGDDRALRLYSVVPSLLASPFDLELFAEQRIRTNGSRQEDFDLAAQLSRALSERLALRFYSRFRERKTRPDGDELFDVVRTPLLGAQLVYGEQQVAELEPRGLFASFDLSGSHEALGGDQDSLRLFTQLAGYRPFRLAGQSFTWGQSLRIGLAGAFEGELEDTLRFRAGGELSVRGYSTESLGPRQLVDDELESLGGEALLVLNQELRYHFATDYAAVVFFDVGNVWAERSSFGEDLRTALGLGGRANTPVGLVRFDIAWPLDRREEDDSVQLYLGLGNTF